MINSVLGISGGLIGLILVIIGVLHFFKGSLGELARGFTSWIPIKNPRLLGVLAIILGVFVFGGLTYGSGLWSSVTAGTASSTASLIGAPPQPTATAYSLTGRFNVINGSDAASNGAANATFVSDTSDLSHYTVYLYNGTNMGPKSIQGILTVTRNGNTQSAETANCELIAGTYRNGVTLTDTAQYTMVATSATKSLVGAIGQETAYLVDGARVATSADSQETVSFVFNGAQGGAPVVQKNLGFIFTLPGATSVSYLANGGQVDNYIKCDTNGDGTYDQTIARITIVKLSN